MFQSQISVFISLYFETYTTSSISLIVPDSALEWKMPVSCSQPYLQSLQHYKSSESVCWMNNWISGLFILTDLLPSQLPQFEIFLL